MNILITSFSFPSPQQKIYDGKFVLSEAIGYAENGGAVRVVTPHFTGVEKVENIHDSITVFRFQYFIPDTLQLLKKPGEPLYNQKSLLAVLQIPFLCFFFVFNILKHSRWADIIHAQWTVTALLCLPAKWLLKKKVVLTARGSDIRLLPVWLNRFIHSSVDGAIDCWGPLPWNDTYKRTFKSNFIELPLLVKKDVSKVMPEDMKRVLKTKVNAFTILYVGRFDYAKIVSNRLPLICLIHACKILMKRNLNFHVFYVGDGDPRIKSQMQELVLGEGLRDYISFLGPKMNVLDYINFSDIGVGGVSLNAVSEEFTIMNKPQILVQGPDNDATPWHHGANCLFVRPEDPQDLAEKLAWAMEHRESIKEMGTAAASEMSRYIADSKSGAGLYLRAFDKLISGSVFSDEDKELKLDSAKSTGWRNSLGLIEHRRRE